MKIPKVVYIIFLPVLIFVVFFLIIKKDTLIIELQNLSRSNHLPKGNKTFPKYGHSDDFSWVAGELGYYSLEGGCWTLRFEEDESTRTEEYNGILALKIPSTLTTGLIDKKFVVVYGEVIGQKFSMACPPNIYEVSSITAN